MTEATRPPSPHGVEAAPAGRADRAPPGAAPEPELSGDRGVATLWAVGAIAAVLVVTVVVAWIAAAANARHQAAAAADLAALAAAGAVVEGQRSACDRARWVVDRMAVSLVSCELDGWDALVEVTVMPPGVFAEFGPAEARARAGPGNSATNARRAVVPAR